MRRIEAFFDRIQVNFNEAYFSASKSQLQLKKAGIIFLAISLSFFMYCVIGLVYLYLSDFPMHGTRTPTHIMFACVGSLMFGMLGTSVLVVSIIIGNTKNK